MTSRINSDSFKMFNIDFHSNIIENRYTNGFFNSTTLIKNFGLGNSKFSQNFLINLLL